VPAALSVGSTSRSPTEEICIDTRTSIPPPARVLSSFWSSRLRNRRRAARVRTRVSGRQRGQDSRAAGRRRGPRGDRQRRHQPGVHGPRPGFVGVVLAGRHRGREPRRRECARSRSTPPPPPARRQGYQRVGSGDGLAAEAGADDLGSRRVSIELVAPGARGIRAFAQLLVGLLHPLVRARPRAEGAGRPGARRRPTIRLRVPPPPGAAGRAAPERAGQSRRPAPRSP
jgi:hypothetical protein